jgi:hypothetical protein
VNFICYVDRVPQGYGVVTRGRFEALMPPVIAGELLKISQGEYVVEKLRSTLIEAVRDDSNLLREFDLNEDLYYTTREVEESLEGRSIVPFEILARLR